MRGILGLLLLLFMGSSVAQVNIPLGTWRTHFSFNRITQVLDAGSRIYAVGENGLFFIDLADNSITTIGKIDGLQENNVSAIGFDPNKEQLIIGYVSGNIDIVVQNEVISLDLVTNSQVLGSKRINHINSINNLAFIATDYGLLELDLNRLEIRETYRQLGSNAEEITVYQSLSMGDSIYLTTEVGVIASDITIGLNLADPNNWRRFDESNGLPQVPYRFITPFNNAPHVVGNDSIYRADGTNWGVIAELSFENLSSVQGNDENLVIVAERQVSTISRDYQATTLSNSSITNPVDAIIANGLFYIADEDSGLLAGSEQGFESIMPSGPNTNSIHRFKFFNNALYALPGGFDEAKLPLGNTSGFNQFEQSVWRSTADLGLMGNFIDVTDAAFDTQSSVTYYATFGNGVLEVDQNNNVTAYNSSNSTLRQVELDENTTNTPITCITHSSEGLWVINYGAPTPLHLLANNEWQFFPLPTSRIVDILNTTNYLWMIVDRTVGGGILVFDKSSGATRILTEQSGNGGLPSNSVLSIDVDLDGRLWVGTARGVAIISSFGNIIEGPVDAIIPIFENRLLLTDEVITSMKVDPGNRKWMGTENGVWLFDEEADRQLQNFTVANSPLPSNEILSIGITENNGEVFFGTSSGVVSYRSDATFAEDTHAEVKVFPNPITSDYQGTVGISGLAFNVDVKITDANGRLIWNTKSAGGTATWDARDYNGRRAATGVYFMFSSSEDGSETFIGKILVVN